MILQTAFYAFTLSSFLNFSFTSFAAALPAPTASPAAAAVATKEASIFRSPRPENAPVVPPAADISEAPPI